MILLIMLTEVHLLMKEGDVMILLIMLTVVHLLMKGEML